MDVDGFHYTSVSQEDGFKIRVSKMEGVQMPADHTLYSSLSRSTRIVGISSCRLFFYREIPLGHICC